MGKQGEEDINALIQESLSFLKIESVETYYLHSPDATTPNEEVLQNINELFNKGNSNSLVFLTFHLPQLESCMRLLKTMIIYCLLCTRETTMLFQ